MIRIALVFSAFTFFGVIGPAVVAQNERPFALDSIFVIPDTARELSLDEFYVLILDNHPVVKQADILTEKARQEIRLARGGFDPKLEASWNIKDFKGTRYYDILNASLKVPVYFPIDAKIDFDRNFGEFLNPENSIPAENDNQQLFIGFSLPVGKGLFIDERRATLQQAKIFAELTEFERIKVINKILLEAAKDYWNWYFSYYNYRLLLRSIDIAQEIFDRVKLNYELGEASVIDTVQAKITLQNRSNDAQLAKIEFFQSGLVLSNYLWDEENIPIGLSEDIVPKYLGDDFFGIEEGVIGELLVQAEANHPELRKLEFKLDQIQIENRLAKEFLKPQLDLSYGWIDEPITGFGETNGLTFDENYKFGLDFSFPIFLRKERSKVQQTELKALETIYERDLRRREIMNLVNGIYFRVINSASILEQQWEIAENYRRLVEAEYLNLESGESDLFRINLQQDKYIESFSKGLKTQVELEKSRAELYWAAGIQNLNFTL